MLIYLIIFLYCLFFHYVAYRVKNKVAKYFLVFFPLICLAFLAGLRDYGVGTDTTYYSKAYFDDARHAQGIGDLLNNNNVHISNKGYLFLNYLGTMMMSHIFIEWFLTELLILVCTYLAVMKISIFYKINLAIFSLLYLFAFYNMSLNLMRQMCAISLCLMSYSYLLEKKYIRVGLLLLVAMTFHTTAAIFLLVFAYHHWAGTNHKKLLFTAITGAMALGILLYYQLLMLLGSLGVFSKIYMERYGLNSQFEGERVPYAFVVVALVIYVGIYMSYRKKILKDDEHYFLLLTHTTFTILMTLNVLVNTLIRISYYFYAMDIVFMAVLLSSRKMHIGYKLALSLVIVFMWLYSYMYLNGNATYPYRSQILGIY